MDLGWLARVLSIFRPETFEGPRRSSYLVDAVIKRLVAAVVDLPVEVLLPEGESSLKLCWSGGSTVVGVDAVGGPPHGDFTDEGGVERTARRRPYGLGAVAEGVVSNVVGEVG